MKQGILQLLVLAAVAVGTATVSSAATIDYSAAGVFNCNGVSGCTGTGTTTATLSSGGASLAIVYAPNSDTVVGPSNTNYGNITLNCTNCNSSVFDLTGLLLNLSIVQGPNPFSQGPTALTTGTFSGSLTVTGNKQSGLPMITFSPTTPALTMGPTGGIKVTYTVDSPLRPSVTNTVNITGTVDAQAPEPATVGLIGLGLAAVGLIRRRKQAV